MSRPGETLGCVHIECGVLQSWRNPGIKEGYGEGRKEIIRDQKS
jgi:hypothetical protein